jgi:hypothetical protein
LPISKAWRQERIEPTQPLHRIIEQLELHIYY